MILTTIIGERPGRASRYLTEFYLPGNVFVMAAILTDRHLQSVANYLILSLGNKYSQVITNLLLPLLALADLLVALLVMPLGAFNEVSSV